MLKKIMLASAMGVLVFGATAYANTITVGGGVADWGITDPTQGLVTSDALKAPKTGVINGVAYWEEKGVGSYWGEVGPGYGGYAYDIQGLYFTYDSNNFYFAALIGMPPGGFNGGLWGTTQWATSETGNNEFMGDIALDFNGDLNYEHGIETGATPADRYGAAGLTTGSFYSVNPTTGWTAGQDFAQSKPVNMKDGAVLVGAGDFTYGTLVETSLGGIGGLADDLYYIEAKIDRPASFDNGGTLNIHLTQTCGNDVGDLHATVAPVPEPATMLLLGTGLIGLAGVVRRKK